MKKVYPVFYLPTAERDSSSRAARFADKIDSKISRLARFPMSGFVPKDICLERKGYRILVVDNYLVFYRLEKVNIIIFRVIHGKRQYGFLFGGLTDA